MKKLLLVTALVLAAICQAESQKVKVYAHPALIYDDAHFSIYQDYMSDISFHFFYVGKQIYDLKSSGTQFFITIPEDIELLEAGLMDRWKNPTELRTTFKKEKKVINGKNYIRYELPVPTCVLQPALTKPLPGGMFGGTSNNIVTLIVKPSKPLPEKSMVYWELTGKYPYKGQFSVYPVKLDLKGLQKSRIKIQSHTNIPAFAYSRRAITDQARLYKDLKVDAIDTQLATGTNRGYKDIWDKGGFDVFGGGSLMHVFWYNPQGIDKNQKIEDRDFLTGINGVNGRYINKAAYHGRAFCPQAVITPGRYPYKKLLKLGREAAEAGATWLDIDIEADYCIQCYCAECLEAFFKFAKIKPEKLSPVALVQKYPKEWYYFRNEQTRQLYQILKDNLTKDFPKLKIGANTVLHEWAKDLGELKYGVCTFAEDPRLMKGTLDFIMADTLMGGVYDAITVDAMSRSSNIPIIAIPGTSYCVGYTAGVMNGRRMTAEMTGSTYGYEQRYENHRLSMLHIAASGAAVLRYGINEACIGKATVEALKILKQVEDFYLDGKRADKNAAVADVTSGVSRWSLDKSRIRGGIWKYFYDNWNGKVQTRMHVLNGDYALGLYNWDPWQNKKWHIRLKDIPEGNWYLTEVTTGKRITMNGKKIWTTAELKKGFVMEIPKIDCHIIKFTRKAIPAAGEITLKCEATTAVPYNQYAWRTGGQHDFKQIMIKQQKRPLNLIKLHGKTIVKENTNMKTSTVAVIAAAVTTLTAADFPLTVDFKDVAKAGISAKVENNAIVSKQNYYFGTMQLPELNKNVLFTIKTNGKNAKLGIQQYGMDNKRISIPLWLYPVNGTVEIKFIIPASKLKVPSKLSFYSIGKKEISITAMKAEFTDKTKVDAPKVAPKHPAVPIPFKADLNKKQSGVSINGKAANGKITINKGYNIGTITLPATKEALSCTFTMSTNDGATLGLVLYDIDNFGRPAKALARYAWGKRLGQAGEKIDFAIPASPKQRLLLLYNTAKTGNIIVEGFEIGKLQ